MCSLPCSISHRATTKTQQKTAEKFGSSGNTVQACIEHIFLTTLSAICLSTTYLHNRKYIFISECIYENKPIGCCFLPFFLSLMQRNAINRRRTDNEREICRLFRTVFSPHLLRDFTKNQNDLFHFACHCSANGGRIGFIWIKIRWFIARCIFHFVTFVPTNVTRIAHFSFNLFPLTWWKYLHFTRSLASGNAINFLNGSLPHWVIPFRNIQMTESYKCARNWQNLASSFSQFLASINSVKQTQATVVQLKQDVHAPKQLLIHHSNAKSLHNSRTGPWRHFRQ